MQIFAVQETYEKSLWFQTFEINGYTVYTTYIWQSPLHSEDNLCWPDISCHPFHLPALVSHLSLKPVLLMSWAMCWYRVFWSPAGCRWLLQLLYDAMEDPMLEWNPFLLDSGGPGRSVFVFLLLLFTLCISQFWSWAQTTLVLFILWDPDYPLFGETTQLCM